MKTAAMTVTVRYSELNLNSDKHSTTDLNSLAICREHHTEGTEV